MAGLKVGDIVMLKSGGSTMTVTHIASDRDLVGCTWLVDGKISRDSFPEGALKVLSEDDAIGV